MSVLRSREALLGLALVLLIALVSTRFAPFAAPANLAAIFTDTSVLITLALGQMAVILTKCIDLSVAANLALTGMVVALVNATAPDVPVLALLFGAMLFGALLGAFNGMLVAGLEIPSIVVTLGTLTIFRGMVFVVSGGAWINSFEMTPGFTAFPRTEVVGLPVLAWIALLVVAAFAVLIRSLPLGRAFYAVGGDDQAARYTGISVARTRFAAFVLSGALSGMCGYLWVSRYAVAYTDAAGGFELDVVAACVIGGVSIGGGIGSVAGVVLGALFLGVIKNALPVAGISPFWQLAISGTAILVAVALNARLERPKGRIILRREPA